MIQESLAKAQCCSRFSRSQTAGDKGAEGQVHDVSDRQDDTFHYSNGEEAAAHPTASPTGTRTAIVPGTVAEIPCFPRSGSMRVI
jgi:hypothetical protein